MKTRRAKRLAELEKELDKLKAIMQAHMMDVNMHGHVAFWDKEKTP